MLTFWYVGGPAPAQSTCYYAADFSGNPLTLNSKKKKCVSQKIIKEEGNEICEVKYTRNRTPCSRHRPTVQLQRRFRSLGTQPADIILNQILIIFSSSAFIAVSIPLFPTKGTLQCRVCTPTNFCPGFVILLGDHPSRSPDPSSLKEVEASANMAPYKADGLQESQTNACSIKALNGVTHVCKESPEYFLTRLSSTLLRNHGEVLDLSLLK